MKTALVIGGGPAGLMAADALLGSGHHVILTEAKPSIGRKFLMAGKSGLNLTKMQAFAPFLATYGAASPALRPMLAAFTPEHVTGWANALGQTTFAGSTGRVFPHSMKASPLLRAWLARLDGMGLDRRTRWRWTGWDRSGAAFSTPVGPQRLEPDAIVLALGGASWSRLGSDGAWVPYLEELGVDLSPFAPSNAGITVEWSGHMAPHFGAPLKNVALTAGNFRNRGEIVLTKSGTEGGALYPLTPALRDGGALRIDLTPDLESSVLAQRLSRANAKQSWSNLLRKALPLSPAARALLMECARPLPKDPAALAELIKALPIPMHGLRPMEEAISTAGGVPFAAMDDGLMLRARPGTFCAGEMIDWEAPTGGYLLTACLATGLWAGQHASRYLDAL